MDPLHPQSRRLSRRDRRQGVARNGCGTKPANMERRSKASRSPSSSGRVDRHLHGHVGLRMRHARTVLLATGVANRRPPMDEQLHDDALARGLVRYCPICDGYEVTDKKVGVIGSGSHGVAEALFMRSYTADVTLIAPDKAMRIAPIIASWRTPGSNASTVPHRPWRSPTIASPSTPPRVTYTFDSIYPALGTDTHTQLAEMVAARLAADGCIVDDHQRTSVPGLYAAGDVVMASTRSATRWVKAGSRQRPSATILRQQPRWREPRYLRKRKRVLGEEFRSRVISAPVEVGDALAERDQRSLAVRRTRSRGGRRRRSSRRQRLCRPAPSRSTAGRPIRSA